MSYTARILIVDDESIRKVISSSLENDGYVADTAENGTEALRRAEVDFYDLALIDVRPPDINGLELLTAVNRISPNTMKIVLTGYPSPQNSVEATKRSAVGYMIKPVAMDELLRTVRQHLRTKRETINHERKGITGSTES